MLYTKAAIALHNLLRTTESSVYCPPGFIDGEDGAGNIIDGTWRAEDDGAGGLESIRRAGGNRYSRCAASVTVRDAYKDYFITPEMEVSWQYDHIRCTN